MGWYELEMSRILYFGFVYGYFTNIYVVSVSFSMRIKYYLKFYHSSTVNIKLLNYSYIGYEISRSFICVCGTAQGKLADVYKRTRIDVLKSSCSLQNYIPYNYNTLKSFYLMFLPSQLDNVIIIFYVPLLKH